ncbi:MAG: hypothetical protein GX640_05230, partial [Fibrobacter sp.]|nr:hypothetical protein [Fibrobacter sp.]
MHNSEFVVSQKSKWEMQTVMFLFMLLFSMSISAQELQIKSKVSKKTYTPGDTVTIGLIVKIPDKFHLYGNPLGPGIGKPLQVKVKNASAVKWLSVYKTKPNTFKPAIGDWVWAYEKEASFFVKGILADTAKGDVQGEIIFEGLICYTSCIPVNNVITFTINVTSERTTTADFAEEPLIVDSYRKATEYFDLTPVSDPVVGTSLSSIDLTGMKLKIPDNSAEIEWDYSPVEPRTEFNLWIAILFGFIAGVIMNAMPCVLPVLGIKILSFSQAQDSSRRVAVIRSLFFSAGILSIFLILASLASFANFSWGEQFQNPKVLVGIIVLIFVFALGMFDIFMIIVPSSISSLEKRSGSGLWGDFFKGMFATILATPCSGPLLGATLAWTLTQPSQIVFAVFSSIGLGMAFPYVVLSSSKTLSRMIPKPGAWMKDFKNLMGFLLLGMATYLMIGLPQDMIVSTVGLCLFVAFAIGVYTRFSPWGSKLIRKIVTAAVALLIIGSGVYLTFGLIYNSMSHEAASAAETDGYSWEAFSPEMVKQAHAKGQTVMIDFTANWCMNCQYNKIMVLHTPEIDKLVKEKNILTLKAD